VTGGQILAFPIDIDRRPYNTLALPCECVIYLTHFLSMYCCGLSTCFHTNMNMNMNMNMNTIHKISTQLWLTKTVVRLSKDQDMKTCLETGHGSKLDYWMTEALTWCGSHRQFRCQSQIVVTRRIIYSSSITVVLQSTNLRTMNWLIVPINNLCGGFFCSYGVRSPYWRHKSVR